jgi:hypothetical protein
MNIATYSYDKGHHQAGQYVSHELQMPATDRNEMHCINTTEVKPWSDP